MAYDTSHDRFCAVRHFSSLDGLRCLSILGVLWHHSLSSHMTDTPILNRGFYGVQLFFVISGFLISTLLLRERDRNGRVSLSGFYMRRTLRIFPLYYTTLLIYAVLIFLVKAGTAEADAFRANLPYHLVYISNWQPEKGPFSFAWSLACEEQFYLLWPLVMILLPKLKPVGFLIAFSILQICVDNFDLFGERSEGSLNWFIARAILIVPNTIVYGIFLAFALHHRKSHAIIARVLGAPGMPIVAFSAMIGLFSLHPIPWGPYSVPIVMTLLVGSVVVREDHIARPLLASAPFVSIGKVSYGIYLFHVLAISVTVRILGGLAPGGSATRFVGATLISWGVAWLSFRYYESIFLRLKKRWAR